MSETPPVMPEYKGAPLDGDRGPGLGCFWIQAGLLVALLILTPLSVVWAWPSMVSAALLILSLVLLFFVGQTMIFLLRLVAADRRTRRRPLGPDAKPTVGQLEDEVPLSEENKAELRRLIPEVVRGERPWQDLREHGLTIHEGPPFDDVHSPGGMPEVKVGRRDVLAGLRKQAEAKRDLRMWAFVTIATSHFGADSDDETDDQVTALLGDASAGVDPAEIVSRLDALGNPPP
ncbi:MAG: hypothetical protein ABI744_06995 [Chloroflexota bacterium]